MTKNKNNIPAAKPDPHHSQLLSWAHEGSEASLKKLSDFIIKEKDKDLREFAQLAYDEAEYLYYSPRNEKEEQEFLLAKMVHERDTRLWELLSKADAAKLELQRLDADRRVHHKIMLDLKKQRPKTSIAEEWQYRFSEDYCQTVQHRLQELEADIVYESAWLAVAKGMITTKRFLKIPAEFWEHVHWDGEGDTFWVDGTDNAPASDMEDAPF